MSILIFGKITTIKQTIADNYDGKFIETEKCNAIYSYKKMPVCVRPKL